MTRIIETKGSVAITLSNDMRVIIKVTYENGDETHVVLDTEEARSVTEALCEALLVVTGRSRCLPPR